MAAAALSTTGSGARGALPDDAAVRAVLPQVPEPVDVVERFPRSSRGHRQATATNRRRTVMTDPERPHTAEPAEGWEPGGDDADGRTPHPQDPAEGAETGGGADIPDA